MNEEANDQENLWFSSRKCSNAAPSRVETKAAWSDEYAESGSIKESLLQKPIICSCCRKRNEAAKANEPMSIFKTRDQCSAGDTLDVVPSKEHNEIARRSDPSQSEQLQKYDIYISSLTLHGDSGCNLLCVQTSSSFATNVNYLNAKITDKGSYANPKFRNLSNFVCK